jgi:hypothetical protein
MVEIPHARLVGASWSTDEIALSAVLRIAPEAGSGTVRDLSGSLKGGAGKTKKTAGPA